MASGMQGDRCEYQPGLMGNEISLAVQAENNVQENNRLHLSAF